MPVPPLHGWLALQSHQVLSLAEEAPTVVLNADPAATASQ